MCFSDFLACFQTFKILCLLNYALMIRHDYDLTSSLRRGALHLSTPSTSRRAGIPVADTPPRNRLLLATPRPGCEVGESSAAVARRPGPTMAHGVDCSYVETRL
nr:hypothetical protein [Tanacetum cinerariifolium]